MIKQIVQDIINKQINAEMYSAYLYLGMAAWCQDQNLPGAAQWLKAQAKEEMGHAMKFYKFLEDTNSQIALKAIDAPPAKWASLLNVFEDAYKHEQKVTGMIYEIVNLAAKEGDHASASMCKWFVDEQVEEESQTLAVVEKLKMAGDSKGALLYIDKELGKRE
ncbi:ferritin [candidate division TA06 bacterium]|uniref:Ferritin n=1 Tax=candidate division TA06 bacterium TaxID=2250710 RepID=A0A933MKI3_UNCT6|nr:ferritin [candidate division TA06 bacterium]